MAKIKFENIGLALKGKGIAIGRKDVLCNVEKIKAVVFAKDMSKSERRKILNVLDKRIKILYCKKSKKELGHIFNRNEIGVFGIKNKFENLLILKEEKSESSKKY